MSCKTEPVAGYIPDKLMTAISTAQWPTAATAMTSCNMRNHRTNNVIFIVTFSA